jgi:glycosyltransferase involved in cell wall biosynthesis
VKVLFVSHSGDFYGAERCLWEAVVALREKNLTLETVVPKEGELSERLGTLNSVVHVIPYTWWAASGHWRRFDYQLRRRLRNRLVAPRFIRLLQHSKPDLVLSNTLTIPAGAWAAKKLGVPHIWFVHEFGEEDHGFQFDFGRRRSFALMNELSARVIANSHALAESLKASIPAGKLRVVYQSVELPSPSTSFSQSETLGLVCVGRLAEGKRQEDAIKALAILIKKGLKVKLTLVGSGELAYRQAMQELSRAEKVGEYVTFAGEVSDPQNYLSRADVALVCSRAEAFGRVTVEAMKAGKPVVGADTGATPELISNGITGFTFAMGNCEDLARKIEIIYHDKSLRKEMGRQAQVWATANFSREKFGSDLLQVFSEVLELPASSTAA